MYISLESRICEFCLFFKVVFSLILRTFQYSVIFRIKTPVWFMSIKKDTFSTVLFERILKYNYVS